MHPIIPKLCEDLRLRGFSDHTIRSYTSHVADYLSTLSKPLTLTNELDVRAYQLLLRDVRQLSPPSINVCLSSVRFLYDVTLNRRMNWKLAPLMKKPKCLPELLTHDEIRALMESTYNLKHKAAFMLAYSAGLRLNEITHLKVTDIDSKNMRIRIQNGKGGKDRYTILSARCLEILRDYWRAYRPKHPDNYLFLGFRNCTRISDDSIGVAFNNAVKRIGITRKVSMHTLRHCFATDLMNSGTNLHEIKELLGHASLQSTSIYLHLASHSHIVSPLDRLYENEVRNANVSANIAIGAAVNYAGGESHA